MKKTIGKRVRKVKAPKTQIDILKLFLQATSELYPCDQTAPGIVASYIRDKKQYYVSLLRYDGANGEGKKVLVAAYGTTLEEAIDAMATKWKEGTTRANELRVTLRRRYPTNTIGSNPATFDGSWGDEEN